MVHSRILQRQKIWKKKHQDERQAHQAKMVLQENDFLGATTLIFEPGEGVIFLEHWLKVHSSSLDLVYMDRLDHPCL